MDDRNLTSYNHGDALLAYFQQLQQQHRFADVTIQCDGAFVCSCHRLILGAFSTHFEAALSGVEGSSTITLDIDSKITGVSAQDLKVIADFMYNGRMQLGEIGRVSSRALGCLSLLELLDSSEDASQGTMVEDSSHAARLLDAVRRFYFEGRFTDVTINCQGCPLASCHRLILCAYSDHFEQALASTENCPLVTLDIDSNITGVTSVDLRTMVEFMYCGILRVQKRRLKSLTAAARALGVTKLVEVLTVGDSQRVSHSFSSNSGTLGPGSLSQISSRRSRGAFVEAVGQPEDPSFDVDAVGATEDVGSTPADTSVDMIGTLIDGYAAEETAGRELTAADEYVDIYEEYVSGPRRGRRGGSYRGGISTGSGSGRTKPRATITSSATRRIPEETSDVDLSLFGGEESGGDADSLSGLGVEESSVAAVTMSYTPGGKRRRITDSYGYGLPEIVGTNDVTVPLLVGDQEMMMEKPFKCPYCDHRTKEKSAVEKHIRCIHTLEAPYKCRYCNQAFKVQSNLVRHIRAHTGEKPYVCKKCGAAYADKKNMDAHVFREHLKMKPLECPAPGCSAKFWRQDRFNYHCRRQHALDPPFPDEQRV